MKPFKSTTEIVIWLIDSNQISETSLYSPFSILLSPTSTAESIKLTAHPETTLRLLLADQEDWLHIRKVPSVKIGLKDRQYVA